MVGIEHIGSPKYYQELLEVIEKLEADGATIRIEAGRGQTRQEGRNDDERMALRALEDQLGTRFDSYKAVGLPWITQRDSVIGQREEAWVRSDVSALNLVRAYGPRNLQVVPQLTAPQSMSYRIEQLKSLKAVFVLRLLRRQLAHRLVARGDKVKKRKLNSHWWDQRVMYAWRECEELCKVLASDAEHQVLIWGAPHMLGLLEGLGRNGFRLASTTWFTVAEMPDKTDPIPMELAEAKNVRVGRNTS